MTTPYFSAKFVAFAASVSILLSATAANASVTTYANDATINVNGVQLLVKAGSVATSVQEKDDGIVVVVPAGEAFELLTGTGRNQLLNDAQLPSCNVQPGSTNRLFIAGPQTVTVTPSSSYCADTSNSYTKASVTALSDPGIVHSGDAKQLFWATSGRTAPALKLRLSVDGGQSYPIVLVDQLIDNGYWTWNVPDMPSTAAARIKFESYELGSMASFSVSDPFVIEGTDEDTVTVTNGAGGLTVAPYDYEVDEEIQRAATIGTDKRIVVDAAAQICHPDSRIKAKGSNAVYYCGADGKRYVFPNYKTYQTWYGDDFAGVVELDLATVAKIPLGGNVTYRPGVRMLKLQSAPDVFAVAADGTLRYVTEAVATRLYGPQWNTMIDDLPDTFFVDYRIGEPVKE